MKIAFFNASVCDRESFERSNVHFGHAIRFFEPRLTADTVGLAAGFPAVCVFVHDVLDAAVVAALTGLGVRIIALRCSGSNNVDLRAARARNLTVVRAPRYSPHAVAEHTVALMLTLNRRIHKAYNRAREGSFAVDGLVGFELHGRTAGVIGAGRIGAATAKILHGFGCRLLVYDLTHNAEVEKFGEYVPLEQLLAESDLVTLHCPLTEATQHVIDQAALDLMKPGAMLINTSRGGLIDMAAAIAALSSGKLGYLGLDVYEEQESAFFEDLSRHGIADDVLERLLTFPNVLITSHQAFLTQEALANIAETTLANIACLERGEPCVNRVEP